MSPVAFQDKPPHYKKHVVIPKSSILTFVDGHFMLQKPITFTLRLGAPVRCYLTESPALTFWNMKVSDVAMINSAIYDVVVTLGRHGIIKYLEHDEFNFFAIDECTRVRNFGTGQPVHHLNLNGITAKVTLRLMGLTNFNVEIKPVIRVEEVVIMGKDEDID